MSDIPSNETPPSLTEVNKSYEALLKNNIFWSSDMKKKDPSFFTGLLSVQTPKFLWIGCSDSRVPPETITLTRPGEIFMHRNIANMVVHTDINLLSVLQYAVEVLGVEHVIVCGHYGCGGVKSAIERHSYGIIDCWLENIKDVYRFNKVELDNIYDSKKKMNRLTELNVIEQTKNLAKTTIIQKSWARFNRPVLHGWIYDLSDGIINPLIDIQPFTSTAMEGDIYKYDF